MVKCVKCGKDIEVEVDPAGIIERDLSYHVACAPRDLLNNAVTEWNAILGRGIQYFVDKYLPKGTKPPSLGPPPKHEAKEEQSIAYADVFARMGKKFRDELKSRT